jgi:curved DNA-binding protein CbpA
MVDHYKTLGVSPDAEFEVVKAAYKAMIAKYHPDVFNGDRTFAEEKAKAINAAFDILSDPAKRAQHDKERRAASGGEPSSAHRPQPRPQESARPDPPPSGWDDTPRDDPPPRRPSRAMWAASAVAIVIAIALVRAAMTGNSTDLPAAESVPPAISPEDAQAGLTPEQKHEIELAKPLQFSAKTYAIETGYDAGFIPLTDLECRSVGHMMPNASIPSLLPRVGMFADPSSKVVVQLAPGTRYKVYLRTDGNLQSAIRYGGYIGRASLAQVLDGPNGGACGFLHGAQIDYQIYLEKNPTYPIALKEANALKARLRYEGGVDGFRERLMANLMGRAKELGIRPADYRDEMDKIANLVSLCAGIDRDRLDAARDDRTGEVRLDRLGEAYASCNQDLGLVSPKSKSRGVLISCLFSLQDKTGKQQFTLDAWIIPEEKGYRHSLLDDILGPMRWGIISANFVAPASPAHG